jgi:cytochrome c
VDSFEWNKLSGWILAAAIAVLGLSIVSAKVFEPVQPKIKGYKVEGVEEVATTGAAAAEAEKPIAFYLASADPAKGEEQFKKCASCHNAAQGGPNAIGPNLYGVVGRPVGKHPGYAYSEAVAGHGGNWDWDSLNDWLKHPKVHIAGNKMSFAGIANPQDRANLIAWLNTQGSNLPKPPPPAENAAAEQPAATQANTAADTPAPQPGKAPDTVVLDEKTAAAGDGKNIGGPGAPEVTGTSAREPAKK